MQPIIDSQAIFLIRSFENVLTTLYGCDVQLVMHKGGTKVTETLVRDCVCRIFEVTWKQIQSASKQRECVTARQAYCFLMRKYVKGYTVEKIGELVNRHHTTVTTSVQTIENYLFTKDKYVEETMNSIMEQFKIFKENEPEKIQDENDTPDDGRLILHDLLTDRNKASQ